MSTLANNIKIKNLHVRFTTRNESIQAVGGVSLDFNPAKISGLIGETGSGKSVLAMSLLRLLPSNATVQGNIYYGEEEITKMNQKRLRQLRSAQIALIPQSPGASLNAVLKLGNQVAEGLNILKNEQWQPKKLSKNKFRVKKIVEKILCKLGISQTVNLYPFQLSGGMRQRVLSSIALIRRPEWILADEPTKGLDPELRNTVAMLMKKIIKQLQAGLIVITHDILLASQLCDLVFVMYAGKIVESGPIKEIFNHPQHPYTKALLAALPNRGLKAMKGNCPAMGNLPSGCVFHPRCQSRLPICSMKDPISIKTSTDRTVNCHLYN